MTPEAKAHRDAEATLYPDVFVWRYTNADTPRLTGAEYCKLGFSDGFDSGYEFARKEILDEEKILKIVRKWKHGWMNQRQNSEEDYQNYFARAFGVDSNMVHSLVKQIVDTFNNQPQPEGE